MGVNGHQNRSGKKVAGGSTLGLLLLLVYFFAQPVLNEKLGLNLPGLRGAGTSVNSTDELVASNSQASKGFEGPKAEQASDAPANSVPSEPASTEVSSTEGSSTNSSTEEGLLYGVLREVGPDRYLSAAGLMYGPGSQEGHRLKHLERHLEDSPQRPGSHGVFDGGMEAALKVIDEGYERAKSGKSGVTKEVDDPRTIYTINMGKRIGFVGGRDGNRRNKPMARRLRIVVDGNQLITAFPL